jgi:DNA-binding beta-propeller fold protein YncE
MKILFRVALLFFLAVAVILIHWECSGSNSELSDHSPKATLPGKYNRFTLLPNGWKLSPVGDQVPIGEFPLNLVVTKDGKYAITSNSGTKENSLSVIDLKKKKEVQRVIFDKTWYGLVFNDDESKVFVSGGDNDEVYDYNFNKGKLIPADTIFIGNKSSKKSLSITGIDYVKSKNYLLAVSKESNTLYVISLQNKNILKSVELDGACYDVKADHKGNFAYVSVWSNAEVEKIDLNNFYMTSKIKVGDHPCQLLITGDDSRLFVANANNNTASVVDLKKDVETEKLNSALSTDAPFGSTPNAICFNSDESVLFVVNADNNYLALFDISKPNHSKSIGFIPVGWYPTAIKYSAAANQIIVANGKGITSLPNPQGPVPGKINDMKAKQYIGFLFKGTLSIINFPSQKELSELSRKVYENTPYISKEKNWQGIQNVIPDHYNLKQSEKIKHVFYIIKENRTYDEVFGDLLNGNGDSSLCFFPYNITPNQHKLAEEFTLYDNFYVDAEVSEDGHNWSTAAYATDYVEKEWPEFVGRHLKMPYRFEGGYPLAAPSSGYIWNDVLKHGGTFRDYGEFVDSVKGRKGLYQGRDEDLHGFVCETYPGWDLNISDLYRYKMWKKDFEKFVENDSLPEFNILRLPNDHTYGTVKGKLTPRAYVAQNDYAVGLIVQEISHSKYWKSSVIFILEDDAQDGSDHVDAHRSTLLVISPYIKRHFVDHTMYSTSGVLKTIELTLGLPQMTQFDLSATPVLFSISNKPDFGSFNVIKPKIDINGTNTADAYGSEECEHLNFAREDAVPEQEFNEILWKAIKGENTVMPAPVRSSFVRVHEQQGIDKDK